MRQDVITGLAVEVHRLGYFVELIIGADSRYLEWAIISRIDSGGFVVVPEDAGAHGRILNRRQPKSNR
jgi:hypothetical protein